MRKKAKYILASLLMFCFTTSVKAEECSYDKQVELNNLAATVKVIYEETQVGSGTYYIPEKDGDPDGEIMLNGFKVKILNLSKDIYATVESDINNGDGTYYYSNTNKGTIELPQHLADNVYNYTIVISSNVEGCGGKELRTINLVVPRYNELSEYNVCKEYSEFEYCQKYTTSLEDISMTEFTNRIEEYKKSHESKTESSEKEQKNTIKKIFTNKKVIISMVVIIVMGVATAAILVIRRRSRLI